MNVNLQEIPHLTRVIKKGKIDPRIKVINAATLARALDLYAFFSLSLLLLLLFWIQPNNYEMVEAIRKHRTHVSKMPSACTRFVVDFL